MNQPPVRFGDLATAAGAMLVDGDPELQISNVHYDSRLLLPGGLFVALRGGYVDGHDYVADAVRRGAVAALVERLPENMSLQTFAIAPDTRSALSSLAARFYAYPGDSLGVIGVTGTDGKTTTSYLIDALLRRNGLRTGFVGTVAIRIADQLVEHDTRQTTPESLEVQRLLSDMREQQVDWAVLEATSHALALPRLNDCPFDIAVVTNVTREHLDFHGSVELYRAAKARLLERVSHRGERSYSTGAVINADDPGARSIAHAGSNIPILWFSTSDASADLFAHSIQPHTGGTRFTLKILDRETVIDLKLLGRYNVFNALAAAGAGAILGLGLDEIRPGLESLRKVPGRLEPIDAGQPFSVIVDYAHSPASLRETLQLLRNVTGGRLIAVFGSAGERDRGKRPEQGRISAELADISIFTSEDPRFEDPEQIIVEIADGARSAGAVDNRDFYCIENREHAIGRALELARPGDTVLLAGKGHERCIIYGDQRVPWDEAFAARKLLSSLGYEGAERDPKGQA